MVFLNGLHGTATAVRRSARDSFDLPGVLADGNSLVPAWSGGYNDMKIWEGDTIEQKMGCLDRSTLLSGVGVGV